MPQGFMDDLKCEVTGDKIHKCTLWNDILSADLHSEDNIPEYRSRLLSRILRNRLHRLGAVVECIVIPHSIGKLDIDR